jgi:glycosyltransferase involved in cell wall biosynthesis
MIDVSIIILAHKESEYIDKCILSAKNQKFNGSFEVILSSDNEPKLQEVSKKHGLIFNLCTDNKIKGSCSANLNSAVKIAKGKYIKVLPYDDWLNDDSIELLYNNITSTEHSLIFANSDDVDGDKIKLIKPKTTDFSLESLKKTNFIHGGTVLFKREDFINLGGYDTNLKFAEEYDFHLRLLNSGKTIKYLNNTVFNYRIHTNQKGLTSLTKEQRIEKRKLVNHIRTQFDNKKIICGLATIYSRRKGLEECVKSLINQVDNLIIYQNGYKEYFDFLKNDKIEIISSLDTGIDMGDAGKFYKVSDFKNCYYFSVDDDLSYPNNYVKNTIHNLKSWNNNVIVSYHGRILKSDAISYYSDKIKVNHCLHDQKEDEFIQFGGTGVMAFDTNMVKFDFNYFKKPNMADIWVGVYAQNNNIPILCLEHKKGWIKETDAKDDYTIFNTHSKKDNGQNELIKQYNKKLILNYDLLEYKVSKNNEVSNEVNKNLQLSIIIPTYSNPIHLFECLDSVLDSIKDSYCEILVGIDGCQKTKESLKDKVFDERIKFFYFNKNVGPYIVKNTLSLKTKSDYILFFDSDDIMINDLIIDIITYKKTTQLIKPMYLNFTNETSKIDKKIKTSKHYGEGVFGINKDLFLKMNGFEGWRCAADSELMGRLYKHKVKLIHTRRIGFYRRVHSNSLTQHSDTNSNSTLRRSYINLMKKKTNFGPLPKLTTEYCEVLILSNIKINQYSKIDEKKDIVSDLLNNVILISPPKNKKKVDINYNKVNQILQTKGTYNPKGHVKPQIIQKPKETPITPKEDSIVKLKREMFQTKPKRKGGSPNIFGNSQRRKGGFSI